MERLKGKVALITGAVQGIGLATAQMFVQEGARVILADRLDQAGQREASQLGPLAQYQHLDVTQPEEWKALLEKMIQEFGALDILVNVANDPDEKNTSMPQEQMTLETWDQVHHINSDGVFLGCKFGIEFMKSNPKTASIINVSSRSGLVTIPGASMSASSKISVRDHTKSVALYCAQKKYPIRCNCVYPTAILTPLWEPYLGKGQSRAENLRRMEMEVPIRRLGRPEEVASAIVFLASDECLFMTGAEIVIDGGVLAGASETRVQPQKSQNYRAV